MAGPLPCRYHKGQYVCKLCHVTLTQRVSLARQHCTRQHVEVLGAQNLQRSGCWGSSWLCCRVTSGAWYRLLLLHIAASATATTA